MNAMFQHRIVFLSVWLAGVVPLYFFPGWEVKPFFIGLIIGSWPFLLLENQSLPGYVVLASASIALSGLIIGLCAWAMDKARLTRIIWLVLLVLVIAGAATGYGWQHDRFESFKDWGVHGWDPTRKDFNLRVLFPCMLALGMWGLYLTVLIGLVASLAAILFRRRLPVKAE